MTKPKRFERSIDPRNERKVVIASLLQKKRKGVVLSKSEQAMLDSWR